MSEYLLGTSEHELARLALQQEVWGDATRGFLAGLPVRRGGRCLDAGCGSGEAIPSLRERLGPEGEIVALDPHAAWIERLGQRAAEEGWERVRAVVGSVDDLGSAAAAPALAPPFDLVFARYLLEFLPDPDAAVRALASVLAPRGVLAFLDYNHEGISVFPDSPGFRAAVEALRAAYRAKGGNPWLSGRAVALLRGAGLEPVHLEPFVLAGGPGSPVHRWLDAFFPYHAQQWVADGLLSEADHERFRAEWEERRADPDALFFSPIVVGAAGRKP